MIKIVNKQDCCGCSACVQRCPKHCITLKEDGEGFLYPHVNSDECIDCGLCEKVCPELHHGERHIPLEVYAAKNKDESIRMQSSSGGIFTLLAEKVIQEGGVVFGAAFDVNWEVMHTYAETMEGLVDFRGSKYMQSRIGTAYQDAEYFLKQGRKVLFSGSPCQIKGLKLFLRKNYDNLIAVDFICHGVPSPKVWREYLKETIARKSGKNSVLPYPIPCKIGIDTVDFRSKSTGWKKFSFALTLSETSVEGVKNTVLLSSVFSENPFMRAFLADLILRPSCYSCPSKSGRSGSDLTIADYWAIPQVAPEFDDDKGVSLVLVQTEKGKSFYQSLKEKTTFIVTSYQEAQGANGGFKEKTPMHPKRSRFFTEFAQSDDIIGLIDRTLRIPLYRKLLKKVKNGIKKMLKSDK
ncbi:Coenzyme F420 hydrogenase/dehydrogenase, beta subunit C-terminal domain [Bacteroides sp. An269]|uniref:Coenzyme F420 hydrogenase/dehydrogenase, beta subunit C-terminal domain n=1 Tax=Bacteroides sp. An269 TaxID=1965613 RepID=UPI000B37FD40|nr:Coenzyme F420 hydrogenase/dehydrogenase, beta subunit C-terminal domain [Bacteroides sp. An269]OUO70372.1 F420H(2):quinone oxidoreductase [Bacteroides sp. An269]